MLNPFPDLLWLSVMVPFILRLALGSVVLFEGYKRLIAKHTHFRALFTEHWPIRGALLLWIVGVLEVLVGVLLLVGLYTQVAALLIVVIVFAANIIPHGSLFLVQGKKLYLFIFIIALSLLVSGAGPFAFDLPL